MEDWDSPFSTRKLLLISFVLVAVIKVALAALLDLYSDEIFYWQASTMPAIAYSDLPFMTALLAGVGSNLMPASAIAVRAIFLVMGSAVPMLVYWIAKEIVRKAYALEAAALSLCIPLVGFLGLLAVPDVPLVFFGLLSFGFFERAIRLNRIPYWTVLGLVVACGLSTHYRFAPLVFGALIFLLSVKSVRHLWREPGLWLAGLIGSIGLIPIAVFNLTNDLSGLGYHLFERHPWEFQSAGFLHVFKQAGLVTPLLYATLLITLIYLIKLARSGHTQAALAICIVIPNLATYLILAPWADSTRTSIHWPLSGYLPLLIFMPEVLRKIYHWLEVRVGKAWANRYLIATPTIGFIGTLVALLGVGSQAFHAQLQPIVGDEILSNKMAGWKAFSTHTSLVLEQQFTNSEYIVISDNYYTSAQLEFALGESVTAYTNDNDKAVRDGRIAQYAIWRRNESGFGDLTGKHALFVTEDSTLTIPDKQQALNSICQAAGRVSFLEQLQLLNGEKQFTFYKVEQLGGEPEAGSCPYPSQGWIDSPEAGATVSGSLQVSGWVFNEDIGVDSVTLRVGRDFTAPMQYGNPRPDVVIAMNITSDPNRPDLGFDYLLDTTQFDNGEVSIAIEITNKVGEVQVYGDRTVRIQNR